MCETGKLEIGNFWGLGSGLGWGRGVGVGVGSGLGLRTFVSGSMQRGKIENSKWEIENTLEIR